VHRCLGAQHNETWVILNRDTPGTLIAAWFNKLLKLLALPREVREVSKFNGLQKGLGQGRPIVSQYILAGSPKPDAEGVERAVNSVTVAELYRDQSIIETEGGPRPAYRQWSVEVGRVALSKLTP
jgi:hypothetical protein